MSVQVIIFLLLFGGVQGLLFTLFLVRRKLHRSGYIFLLLYFGVLLLQITLKVMNKGWLMENWRMLYNMSYELPFLYGPLAYFFARRMTGGKWNYLQLLHFIPFIFVAVTHFVPGLRALRPRGDASLMFQLFSVAVYHWFAYHHWQRYTGSLKKYYSNVEKLQLRWLRQFIVLSFVLCALISLSIYWMYTTYPRMNWLVYGFASLTLFIYWVSYSALTQPDIFSVIIGNAAAREPAIVTDITPRLQVSRPAPKYKNSSLPEEESARIVLELDALMGNAKPQLDPEITIDKLAKLVSSNRHHLSQVLNEKIGLSFYDYINSYRVNEACMFLTDPARANHKIASIAYDAGFNSLSAFNEVFKKMTGQTPSQYKKHPQAPAKVQRG